MRAEALAARRAFAVSLTPELRARLEEMLAEHVAPHLAGAGAIAFYHPLRDEISPLALAARLSPDQRALFPWFLDRDARMLFREGPASEPSPWGVLQPPGGADALAPDIVLVPLVAVDRLGRRIGHGKGHYDRALAHLRAGGSVTAIGVGWDSQLLDLTIAADPWDVPLDAVATPAGFLRCR